jgi:hypothetical protein
MKQTAFWRAKNGECAACLKYSVRIFLTPYRDSVNGTSDHVTYQNLVTRYRYEHVRCAIGIWPSRQRDDTVTAWSRLDVQRDTSPPSAPFAFFTFMMLLVPVTNWEPHVLTLAGYCYARRHGMEVQIVTPYRVSHLQRYGVMVRGNVTSVYPPVEMLNNIAESKDLETRAWGQDVTKETVLRVWGQR